MEFLELDAEWCGCVLVYFLASCNLVHQLSNYFALTVVGAQHAYRCRGCCCRAVVVGAVVVGAVVVRTVVVGLLLYGLLL